MFLSERIKQIPPSPTLTINAKANELKAQGKDIISLAAGEPDFPPPDHVLDAARKAIEQKITRYTAVAGIPELLEAVGRYFKKFYHIDTAREQVIVTNGGKQGLFNLCQILLNPGDEVLLPIPYWVSYPAMVQLAGGIVKTVPTQAESNFLVSVKGLENALSPKTKVLILNSPSNPTGCHYNQDQLDEIITWALDNNLFVISDEIYDRLVYSPAKPASAAKWLANKPEQIAIVNGLSKSFALTGVRIGYVLSAPHIIKALIKIQGQSTSNICTIAQHAALAALNGAFDFLEEKRKIFQNRRDKALALIKDWPNTNCPTPDGAFYLFPKVSGLYGDQIKDSTEMCTYLLDEAGVALIPGAAFGDDQCIRLSYATDDKTLLLGLDKIGQALQKIS